MQFIEGKYVVPHAINKTAFFVKICSRVVGLVDWPCCYCDKEM